MDFYLAAECKRWTLERTQRKPLIPGFLHTGDLGYREPSWTPVEESAI